MKRYFFIVGWLIVLGGLFLLINPSHYLPITNHQPLSTNHEPPTTSHKSPIINAERVISLSPQITSSIYLLGAQEKLVGVTSYCKAKGVEVVGSIKEINIEKILKLKPDLIFATDLNDKAQIEYIESFGLNVMALPIPKSFNELCEQFVLIGKILGKEKRAKEIIQELQIRLQKILNQSPKNADHYSQSINHQPPPTSHQSPTTIHQSPITNHHPPKVFIQLGAKPLFTATKDSYIDEMISMAGGINIGRDSKKGLYSIEKVIEKNPDVIIIIDMGIEAENEKKRWKKFKMLNAVKNNAIYFIDAYKIGSPNPQEFVETVEMLSKLIHN
ncbi:ABC transporter substrate-binding protein [Thermodesulfovibrio hydrogeniphilus]